MLKGGEEDWSRILGKWSGGEDVDGFGEIYDISERFAACSLFCVSLFLSFSLFFFFLLFFLEMVLLNASFKLVP